MNYTSTFPRPTYAPVSAVNVNDPFFSTFLEKIRTVTVPDVFAKFLADGAIENYERVARGERGGHAGPPWYHGLICEVIRGVSDLLAVQYNAELDMKLDNIIDAIRRAQAADPDGWINPYTTLMIPSKRWGLNGGNVRWQHETYNAGCLTEAGVHHYRATGKTTLLEVAVKMNNYLASKIGDAPKWNVVCEHSVAEMALVSLERLFDEEPELAEKVSAQRGEYIRLAKFYIDHKGDNRNRHQFPPFLQEYAQDHRPAREQREAVGHAVRATLFYTGMAETAAATDDAELAEVAEVIWRDITEAKLHINGSVGAHRDDERFGAQYELPNNAYLETCAGVGLAFFGASLFRLTREASVWDTVENTLTNLMPASVSEDGVHYTYENPLETHGGMERWSWHECPCCPPMLLKLAGVMPSYIWAKEEDDLWLNLYVDSAAELDGVKVSLQNGLIRISAPSRVKLHIRIPIWAKNFSIRRGSEVLKTPVEKGYAVVDCTSADALTVSYDAPAVKIMAHPLVDADRGRIAVRRGPVLYCCEKAVDKWKDLDPVLDGSDPVLHDDSTISVKTISGEEFKLTEYRSWNNHGALPMRIWFRQDGLRQDPANLTGWDGLLYREFH